jgi:hypothetical protein
MTKSNEETSIKQAAKVTTLYSAQDRLCGLVARVPGLDSRRYQVFWEVVGLERGPLNLVRIIEELLERKVAAPV